MAGFSKNLTSKRLANQEFYKLKTLDPTKAIENSL